jgi:hypothetical protein
VFVAEGRKIGLLPNEVNFYRRSQQVFITITERSLFRSVHEVPWAVLWRSFVPPSVLPLKRTMDNRESIFDETTAHNAVFGRTFFASRIGQ